MQYDANRVDEAKTPLASSEQKGEDYKDVIKVFEKKVL